MLITKTFIKLEEGEYEKNYTGVAYGDKFIPYVRMQLFGKAPGIIESSDGSIAIYPRKKKKK